ncbi:MAG: glycosyltransferase family 4 protein [Bacteroidetes bacterium]|nr:glycosyltransferase family 4 protein [Bacteroidota bacterium]
MKKVIFVTNIPNPYRIPLFNEMSIQFQEKGIHLKIVFGAATYKRRFFKLEPDEMKFDYEILQDKGHSFSEDGEKTIFFYRGLDAIMNREKPDAMIVAGFSPATLKIFKRKLFKGTPYIIFSGTIERGKRNQNFIRTVQRKLLCKYATSFVAYGNMAKKYLVKTGAPEKTVFIARNTVDTSFFAAETENLRKLSPHNNSITHFTYLGYLVPRKNVLLLLQSVKLVAEKRSDFKLDILGDGISLNELKSYVSTNQLDNIVEFHGFRQKKELPAFFARSSGLLFQTDFDIWGLVLNEAMAAGVPCLASPNAGATYDLIDEGKTGFVVDFTDTKMVAEKIIWLIEHPKEAAQIGKNAADYIRKNVTIKHAAKGFLDATCYALKIN